MIKKKFRGRDDPTHVSSLSVPMAHKLRNCDFPENPDLFAETNKYKLYKERF